MPSIASIPISLWYWRSDPIMGHMVTVSGVLRLTTSTLVIEYEEAWRDSSTFQQRQGDMQRAEVRLDRLSSVSLRRRILRGPQLRLQASFLDALQGFPSHSGPEWVVAFARRAAAQAAEFVTELGDAIADRRLRYLEGGGA